MKKILLILIASISVYCSYSQNQPVVPRSGVTVVAQDARTGAKYNFYAPAYNDTTQANIPSNLGIDSCGAIIFTYSDNGLWLRKCSPKRWEQVGTGSNNGNDTIYVKLPLHVHIDSAGNRIIEILIDDGLITPGYVIYTGSGLDFIVTAATFQLNFNFYASAQRTITLDAADPTYSRIDKFAVDTTPLAIVLTGIPEAIPIEPQIDPASQLALTTGITINPGDTTPSNVQLISIYDENLGVPDEWAVTSNGTITFDKDNTDNPYHLVKDIYVSSYNNGSRLNFTSASTNTFQNGEIVFFAVYLNGALGTNRLRLQFFNGTTASSTSIAINNTYGLNPNDSNEYQIIAVPLSAFQWNQNGNGNIFDQLRITFLGTDNSGAKGLYIDFINLQLGVIPIPPPTDYSNKQDSNHVSNDSLFWCVKGICKYLGQVNSGNDTAVVAINQAPDSTYWLLIHSNRGIQLPTDTLRVLGSRGNTDSTLQQAFDKSLLAGDNPTINGSDISISMSGSQVFLGTDTTLILNSNGSIRLNQYGQGSFQDNPPVYNLSEDGSGNVIETNLPTMQDTYNQTYIGYPGVIPFNTISGSSQTPFVLADFPSFGLSSNTELDPNRSASFQIVTSDTALTSDGVRSLIYMGALNPTADTAITMGWEMKTAYHLDSYQPRIRMFVGQSGISDTNYARSQQLLMTGNYTKFSPINESDDNLRMIFSGVERLSTIDSIWGAKGDTLVKVPYSGGGGGNTIYSADDSLTGDRVVDLNGHSLTINQSDNINLGLFINPTVGNQHLIMQSWDNTGDGNYSNLQLDSYVDAGQFRLQADFNDDIETSIMGQATTDGSTITYTAGTHIFNGAVVFNNTAQLAAYTVATLPTGVQGMTAYVTDALTPTFGATLVGGGSVVAKAFFDGTNWINE